MRKDLNRPRAVETAPEEPSSAPGPMVNYPSRQAGRAVIKVVRRCNYAKENQKLDLSDCQLMQVPDAVYHLMRHTVILQCNLSNNVIRKIPSKFMLKFGNITELNLSHNQLSSLPDEIRDLADLQKLDISGNHFLTIPKSVFKLPILTFLNAKKNYITEVDVEKLSAAPALKEINLSGNTLSASTCKQLDALSHITVKRGDITEDEEDRPVNDDITEQTSNQENED